VGCKTLLVCPKLNFRSFPFATLSGLSKHVVLLERAQTSKRELVPPPHIEVFEALFVLRLLRRLSFQPHAPGYLGQVGE
jgi:hypothetical protein